MKKSLWILLAVLCLSACCHTDKHLISDAETLVENDQSDSALVLLNRVENFDELSQEWQARYWLVTIEAHADVGESLSEDSAIITALSYYENHQPIDSVKLRKARAYTASYYWWTGRQQEARKLMDQSLRESRQSGSTDETIFMLHGMTDLAFADQDVDHAAQYVENIVRLEGGDINHANLLNRLAVGLFFQGKHQAAIHTFERAIAHIDQAEDSAYVWGVVMRNYADVLISMGQIDRGIQLHDQLLQHYATRPQEYEYEKVGSLFSLSYAWLLKGDTCKASHYMNSMPDITYDDYDASCFCMMGHRMVLSYAITGRYTIADMAEYANEVSRIIAKREAVASAKEQAVQKLRERELWLTVSRQRQLIFFLLLTIGLLTVISVLMVVTHRRRCLLAQKEEELRQLNAQLQSMSAPRDTEITLTGSTSDCITLQIPNLLYIETVGNYLKVYYLSDGQIITDMLRATSRQMEEQLRDYPMIVRCHRAFLVNLQQVEQIVSRCGGMQLQIRHTTDSIPVSRSNVSQVKEAIKRLG